MRGLMRQSVRILSWVVAAPIQMLSLLSGNGGYHQTYPSSNTQTRRTGTPTDQTGNFVYTLLRERRLWEMLVADPGLIPSAVEELLRFIPLAATSSFARIATEDVPLAGEVIRAGEAVLTNLASADRDDTVFTNPDEIDFTRAENPHVAFGHGVHHCLGAPLARLELRMAVTSLVRRLPGLRLAVRAEDVQWRQNRLVRGTLALPVAW